MIENEDLLNLCRLNKMEDNILKDGGFHIVHNKDEVTAIKKIIKFKLKNLANKIINENKGG